jgi:hypothetical protein
MLSLAGLAWVAVVVESCVSMSMVGFAIVLAGTCALPWNPDLFAAGWHPGRVHNRLQRGAVGLGECGYALVCVVG